MMTKRRKIMSNTALDYESVEQLMLLRGCTHEEAEYAFAIQNGKHPERYTEIRDGLGISNEGMFISVIMDANRGLFSSRFDGIEGGRRGGMYKDVDIPPSRPPAIGDALEQEECWICETTITPAETGQCICSACEDEWELEQQPQREPDYDAMARWFSERTLQPVHS
jgi:hypothetical protein